MPENAVEAINNLADAIRGYTEQLKRQDPNRLLSIKDVSEEYKISERSVSDKIFNNSNVVTNRISKDKRIKNSELWKYFDVEHKD